MSIAPDREDSDRGDSDEFQQRVDPHGLVDDSEDHLENPLGFFQ